MRLATDRTGGPYHTDDPRYIDFEHGARVGRFVADIMRAVAYREARLRVLPLEERVFGR